MTLNERFVAKVHPATREIESEDPMELVAMPVDGDANVMLECIVQEFAWMGCDERQLLEMFHSADYPVLASLRESFGEEEIRRQLRIILDRQGAFKVSAVIDDTPDPAELEPELIQIGVRPKR